MKTIIIATVVVAVGLIFGRVMYCTANYFLESIRRNDEDIH